MAVMGAHVVCMQRSQLSVCADVHWGSMAEDGLCAIEPAHTAKSAYRLNTVAACWPAPLLPVDAGTAVFAELETLTWSTINTLKPWLAYKGQELVYEWQGRNLETGQQDDTSQLWPHVLTQLQVTEEQARSLSACYAMFGTCLERLVEERQQLAAAYGFIQEQLEAEKHGGGPLDATKMAEQLSVSLQLLKRMKGNMDAYGSLDKVFATSVTRTLTGVQVAKAIMHSYPYLPSWHDMISHLRKPIGSA